MVPRFHDQKRSDFRALTWSFAECKRCAVVFELFDHGRVFFSIMIE